MTDDGRTVLITRSRVPPGTQLNGIYRVDQPIAAGGMGEVYKGYNIQTGDPVAIKMIRSDLAENEAALQLFRKEASSLHNLHHEAIVRYYIFTVDPQLNRAYLAMEYVDGISLKDLLVRGPLSFEQVCVLQKRIASGLHAAHKMGIIHRDVSPDNVLAPSGNLSEAKILDFGIARSTKAGEQTIIGSGFAGKYNYVSPEQLGMFGGNVTGKSDIYSLGLVLAECLIGRPIDMSGSQVDVIDKRRMIPDLSAIDPRLRPLLSEMLSPHPDDRPDDMAAVAEWLPSKKGTKPKATTRTLPGGARAETQGRSRIPMIAAAMAALVGLGGTGVYFGMTMLNGVGSNSQLAQEERLAQQNQQADAATRAAEARRLADEQQQVALRREAEVRENAARAEAERLRQLEEQRFAEERRQAELRKQEEEQRAAQLRKQAEEQMSVAARQEAARKEAETKAAEARAAEARRIEDEKKAAEARRIDEQKRAAEARIAEAKRIEDEKKAAEARRIDEQKRAAEARIAEAKRIEDEKKAAEARRIDEQKRAAEARIAEAKRIEDEKKSSEAKRLDDEKKAAEAQKRDDEIRASAQMIAEAKRIEEDRAREEARRVEQERIALEQKRLSEDQTLAQRRKEEAEQAALRDAEMEKTRIAQEAAQARWDAELAAALARQGITTAAPTPGIAPQQLALADPATPRAPADPTTTRRGVQTELSRLGCYAGAADGNASKPLETSIRRYRERSKTTGATDPADASLLQELQIQIPERGACECLQGQTPAKNNCAAKASTRPKKQERQEPARQNVRRPAPEPRRQAERPAPRQAAPAPRPAPAPAPAAAARPAGRPNIGGIGF